MTMPPAPAAPTRYSRNPLRRDAPSGLLAVLGGLFAIDIVGRKATGAAMGLVGAFSHLGAAMQENISGRLITTGTTMVDGVRRYDFTNPILFRVGSSVISTLLAATLRKVKVRE